ncbi:MAG TPA: AMP-binding protein [Cyclobacteriaceae bacterium]|nr:AMP-binding protein [Cyclobacteriaceae bacterium]
MTAIPGSHNIIWINGKKISYNDIIHNEIAGLGLEGEFENNTIGLIKNWYGKEEFFSLQSSGSTGSPKTFKASRRMLEASAGLTLKTLQLTQGMNAVLCLDTKYTAGIMMLIRGLIGNQNIYAVNPSADPFSALPEELVIDFIAIVPAQLGSIGKNNSIRRFTDRSNILVGGAPLPAELERRMQSFPGIYFQTFGMAETLSHIALKKLNGKGKSNVYETIGDITVSIAPDGCLAVKAPHLSEDKIITRDIVQLIDDRHFVWKGRADNMINSGGIKIQLEELETEIEKILDSTGIHVNFFITSVPDDILGEKVIMLIEDPGDLYPGEVVIKTLKEKLKKYHLPRDIYRFRDFRYTENGKLDRLNTRKLLETGKGLIT